MVDVSESGLTIKSGRGYENMWATPKGSPAEIKNWLIGVFGFDATEVAELTPYEVAVMAEDLMQGRANVATGLGGTVVKDDDDRKPASGKDAWVEAEEQGEDHSWLIEQLEGAPTTKELKRLWANNKAAFADKEVQAAYNKRGKALKAKGEAA